MPQSSVSQSSDEILRSAPMDKAVLRTDATFTEAKGLTPHLPSDIIGGSVPAIMGLEEEAVWNAASQACGTDRVHFAYTVADGRCWYLAVPSSALASHPDTWCPLAAALPGNSEYWDRESVYVFEQDGVAAGLRWDQDTGRMQIYAGPARVILPRLQSLDANFLTISAEKATPVSWRNLSLQAEKLSRQTVKWLFWTGASTAMICLALWIITHLAVSFLRPNVTVLERETAHATEKLMMEAAQLTRSDAERHFVRIQELLGDLQGLGGTLIKYDVTGNNVVWEAVIPSASGGANLASLGAKAVGSEADGRVRIQGTR
ncbi:MAG TPA: hypothetical protein VGF14_06465 [Alphaproteobacteria bacterium]